MRISPPAHNPRSPSPEMSTVATSGSASNTSSAFSISRTIERVRLLSAFGRLSRIRPSVPVRLMRVCGWVTVAVSDVEGMAKGFQCGFLQAFAAGRMSMDGAGDVFQPRPHFERQREGAGEFGDTRADRLQA